MQARFKLYQLFTTEVAERLEFFREHVLYMYQRYIHVCIF